MTQPGSEHIPSLETIAGFWRTRALEAEETVRILRAHVHAQDAPVVESDDFEGSWE